MKKSNINPYILIFLLAIILIIPTTYSSAQEVLARYPDYYIDDNQIPIIDSIHLDKNTYRPGEMVSGHFLVSENYGLKYAYISFYTSNTPAISLLSTQDIANSSEENIYEDLYLNEENQVIVPFSFEIPENAKKAKYSLDYNYVVDIAGNQSQAFIDKGISFNIEAEPVEEKNSPQLIDFYLDKSQVKEKESINGKLYISDQSKLKDINIAFLRNDNSGYSYIFAQIKSDLDSLIKDDLGTYEVDFEINIPDKNLPGQYTISSIDLVDEHLNKNSYVFDDEKTCFSVVSNRDDFQAPQVLSIRNDKDIYKPGETIKGIMRLKDESEIIKGEVSFANINESGFNKLRSDNINIVRKDTDIYEISYEIPISKYASSGEYILSNLYAIDEFGNSIYLHTKEDLDADHENLRFKINNEEKEIIKNNNLSNEIDKKTNLNIDFVNENEEESLRSTENPKTDDLEIWPYLLIIVSLLIILLIIRRIKKK